MRALVTGGAGFIGTHLVEILLKNKYDVLVVDNFTLGTIKNVNRFINNKKYKFIKIDIDKPEVFCKKLAKEKIDIIYHLAANSDIQRGGNNPIIDYTNTFKTTFSVLELARRKNIKNLFFASSSAIYGDKKGKEMLENSGDLFPISYYGGAKLASEAIISSYTYMNSLNTLLFRFPNVIGPNLTHGVVFDFTKKLENNSNKLEILGNGKQRKPYLYVTDLVDAIFNMTQHIRQGIQIYNIGVETSTSVTSIAKFVCKELGSKNTKFIYKGGDVGWKGDVPKFKFNLDKIHKTGWKASYTSDEAVREAIKHSKQ